MLSINLPSPTSPSLSSCPLSSCSSLEGAAEIGNSRLPMDHVLNMSPRPSYNLSSVVNLEKTAYDQLSLPWESKKPTCLGIFNATVSDETPSKKPSAELVKEIAILEVEIVRMERYLLSLYRSAFEQQLPNLSENHRTQLPSKLRLPLQATTDNSSHMDKAGKRQDGTDCNSQISPAHVLAVTNDHVNSATPKSAGRAKGNAVSKHRSLADHLRPSFFDIMPKGPDKLSEYIVRCISSIYCKLAGPNLNQNGFSFSSSSSLSSSTTFSPRNFSDNWSPHFNEEALGHNQSQGINGENGSNAAMVEVLKIHLDDDTFNYAAQMLQNFRSLVKGLEKVDLRKMKREEKLTFWINIHNALVMHAHLAYGANNYVRTSSVLKAAYNVGGLYINACIIRSSILGIRPHYSASWLQSLLSPGKRFKAGITKHAYAIEYPEPLVHFALSSGAYSDPVVRVYTAKTVFQDLRRAKEEFIQANVYVHRDTRVYLPKILGYFARDMSYTMSDLLEMVNSSLEEDRQNMIRRCVKGKPDKYLYWLPQSSTFRYVIHREVATV